MKDIYATNDNGKFGDIVFESVTYLSKDENGVEKSITVKQIKTIEKELKLLQSLKKLILNDRTEHPLGFGSYKAFFSVDEILRLLSYYNTLTDTTSPEEQIDEIINIKQVNNTYEIILKTKANSIVNLTLGV